MTIAGDEGQLERGGYVIIANHVSYVDGIVLGSIFPIVFVSKREVKNGRLSVSGMCSAGRFLSTGKEKTKWVRWFAR